MVFHPFSLLLISFSGSHPSTAASAFSASAGPWPRRRATAAAAPGRRDAATAPGRGPLPVAGAAAVVGPQQPGPTMTGGWKKHVKKWWFGGLFMKLGLPNGLPYGELSNSWNSDASTHWNMVLSSPEKWVGLENGSTSEMKKQTICGTTGH